MFISSPASSKQWIQPNNHSSLIYWMGNGSSFTLPLNQSYKLRLYDISFSSFSFMYCAMYHICAQCYSCCHCTVQLLALTPASFIALKLCNSFFVGYCSKDFCRCMWWYFRESDAKIISNTSRMRFNVFSVQVVAQLMMKWLDYPLQKL